MYTYNNHLHILLLYYLHMEYFNIYIDIHGIYI